MSGVERQWLAALVLLTAALFVSAGLPLAARWRKILRLSAIGVFILALVVVILDIARWTLSAGPR